MFLKPRTYRTALAALLLLALAVPALSVARAGTPAIRILSPQPEEIVPGPDVTVCFETAGITFSPGGFNLHFVLDDQPFEVQYNPLHPHVFRDVAPGTHTVRVFAADRLHQAVEGTLAMVTFHVEYPDDENRPSPNLPLLTYNLPQGEYMGPDAADILLNFLVTGVELSPRGYRVQYYIDGKRFIASRCRTYPIKNLEPGYHSIRLELIDPKGRLVHGPFNSVERLILVSPDKTPPRWKPGQPPPEEPVIYSIHGPRTSGQPWVAADEAQHGRLRPSERPVRTDGTAKPKFTVRRDETPTQRIPSTARPDDGKTEQEPTDVSDQDRGEETRMTRRADRASEDAQPRRVPMRAAETTAPRNTLTTTSPLVERLQREAGLSLPAETPGTTTLRSTAATTGGVTVEQVEPPPAVPPDGNAPDSTETRRRGRGGDRRPQNKIGNLPNAERPPAETQPPEAGQPAETTEEGRSETR
ncbi:MAG: hypothetical protein N2111_10910 [Candidatus Sumerlaeaceae bacterium]|nr:hypothetical protein [Candidatus Sumerlaeaceae bacterium]